MLSNWAISESTTNMSSNNNYYRIKLPE